MKMWLEEIATAVLLFGLLYIVLIVNCISHFLNSEMFDKVAKCIKYQSNKKHAFLNIESLFA